MADGLNEARRMRITELKWDCNEVQRQIKSHAERVNPPDPESATLMGYAMIIQCKERVNAAMAAVTFTDEKFRGIESELNGDLEKVKALLQPFNLAFSVPRFRLQKVYYQIVRAMAWVNRRAQVLQGRKPSAGDSVRLREIDEQFRKEIAAITDRYVYDQRRAMDVSKGVWLVEDPPLQKILETMQKS